MNMSHISLKWLEVFHLVACHGSVQAAAREAGLSISTVSHHLRSLEAQLGVTLLNHARRPMILTPVGAVFFKNVDEALKQSLSNLKNPQWTFIIYFHSKKYMGQIPLSG